MTMTNILDEIDSLLKNRSHSTYIILNRQNYLLLKETLDYQPYDNLLKYKGLEILITPDDNRTNIRII